jgi:hypothetical protein
MIAEAAAQYESEIRSYLLGRLSPKRTIGVIPLYSSALPTPPIFRWWLFEGKRYRGLTKPLALEWDTIDRQARWLARTHNPYWRDLPFPEGDVDWMATAFASATSAVPRYVCRTSMTGLNDDEASALAGWREWIGSHWKRYVADLGAPAGAPDTVPWTIRDENDYDDRLLKRWALSATRSRWPLLRNIVAETLRSAFEPQLLSQLPLPSEPATLFELVCLVRILRSLEPEPATLRWLDLDAGRNTIVLPGLTCHFQHSIGREVVLATTEFSPALREAIARHAVRIPQRIDALILFERPRRGFRGLLMEMKSGDQEYDRALHQLKCYRAALGSNLPGPFIVWGITETGDSGSWVRQEAPALPVKGAEDLWLFSPASVIPAALNALRL